MKPLHDHRKPEENGRVRPVPWVFPGASSRSAQRGIMLVDCLVYCGMLAVIFGLAFLAFYHTVDNAKHLNRNAAMIITALRAGEKWRADVRSSTAEPRLTEPEQILHLPQPGGEVLYSFHDGGVFRQEVGKTNWHPILPGVKASRMQRDARERIVSWRWELELQSTQKVARVKPLFTFQAVPAKPATP